MASVFGHAIVGYTITKAASIKNYKWLLLLAILSSVLPDLDVLTFNFGIPYSHPFGHRGFTHSIVFAIIWAILLMLLFGKQNRVLWFIVIFFSTVFHGILDAMTTGGKGIGFFIPFNNERFFFPFRPIQVSPLRIEKFFSEWGIQVILSEVKYILIPCIIVLLILKLINKKS
jgi:inner membrane protein